MKQILVLSGKGGTGKTTVASAMIQLSQASAFADCDVDAPNLHLLMNRSDEAQRKDFYAMKVAEIDTSTCTACGLCKDHCKFNAIILAEEYHVNPYSCEGCGVCEWICPHKAIIMKESSAGELKLYTDTSTFSTAQLKMGKGTSGLLVTEVKKRMIANSNSDIAIIDGSPGIGCPVISSISGVDLILLVAEPSLSGMSDLNRIIKTTKTLQVPVVVCINKYDINLDLSRLIEEYCQNQGIKVLGVIPYDEQVIKSVNRGESIIENGGKASEAIRTIYMKTMVVLDAINKTSPDFIIN
jgi:MinD superfamily P-loop ATPase